jgi:hypothetical protein
MTDSRLIGTWRSDGRRTLQEIAARRDIPATQRRKLARFFGKLELRYTRTKCYARMETHASASGYLVLAKDASSVAILSSNSFAGEQIHHIHFEGPYYWILLGSGKVREFFRRVKPKTRTK